MTKLNLNGLDTTGIEIRHGKIRIVFNYLGRRRRETLPVPATRDNVKYAIKKRATVLLEIDKETFNYAAHFPGSPHAKKLSGQSDVLVSDLLVNWLATKKKTTEHSTFYNYQRIIDTQLIPAIGDYYIDTLDSDAINEWLESLGKSEKTQRNYLSPLRQAYDYALSQKKVYGLTSNPMEGVKVKTERKRGATRQHLNTDKNIHPFTPAEIAKLIAKSPDPYIANYILFNVWAGLRSSEMLALAWEDINLNDGVIVVRRARVLGKWKGPKTMAGNRQIKMLTGARIALQGMKPLTFMRQPIEITYHDGERETIRPVFYNPKTDAPWYEPGQFREVFADVCRKADVVYRVPYQMRHTYASTLLSAYENPLWVAQQMGHEDWGLLINTYGKYIPDVDPHAGDKADKLYKGARDVLATIK